MKNIRLLNLIKAISVGLCLTTSLIANAQFQLTDQNNRIFSAKDVTGQVTGSFTCNRNGIEAFVDNKPISQLYVDGLMAEPLAIILHDNINLIKMDNYYFEGGFEDSIWDLFEGCYPIQKEH